MSIESVMPSSYLILCRPLLFLSPIPPSIRVFSSESTLPMRWPKYWEFQLHQSYQWIPRTDLLYDGLVGSPCSPRDSHESSSTPQFKSINSLALSFLHSPILTSTHDHWKNHSLDQTDICWQSNVSAFKYAIQVGPNFPSICLPKRYVFFFKLFILGCTGSLVHAGFSLVAVSKGYSNVVVRGACFVEEHRLSSCGTWAQLPCSMWDLPGPEKEPVSSVLADKIQPLVHQGSPPKDMFKS